MLASFSKHNCKSLRLAIAHDKLKAMALELGYQYGADGNTGKFLDEIAQVPVEEIEKLLCQLNE